MNPFNKSAYAPSLLDTILPADLGRNAALILASLLATIIIATGARAQGTAQFTAQAGGPGSYNYDITLSNTGANTIGTFWFGWIPGADYLPSNPTSVTPPAGWTDYVEGGYYGGYSIEYTATGAGLAPGASVDFLFSSPDSPATLLGNSANIYYPHDPITTSYTYIGLPFYDAGNQFVVTPAPEPSTWALLGFGAAGLWTMRRRT